PALSTLPLHDALPSWRPGYGLHPFSGVTASVCQLRPESRGVIRIKTPDPFDPPSIVANYLATETDREVTLAGMRLLRKIGAQPQDRKSTRLNSSHVKI